MSQGGRSAGGRRPRAARFFSINFGPPSRSHIPVASAAQPGPNQPPPEMPATHVLLPTHGVVDPILLRPEDLPIVRARARGGEHAAARDALNAYIRDGPPLQDFPWGEYMATHKSATELVDPGVSAFTCEEILETRDPNRRDPATGFLRPRVDFIVRRADGSTYRLRPDTRPK